MSERVTDEQRARVACKGLISNNASAVFVLGAPGSGKGTLCKRLMNDAELNAAHGVPVLHISVGDVLRKRKAEGALSPEQCRKIQDQELMDGRDIVAFMKDDLEKMKLEKHFVVIDGFPRSLDQMRAFEDSMGISSLVISLQCPREVALQRYLARHDPTRPGGNEEVFSKRFAEFETENPKILDRHEQFRGTVIEVDVSSTKGIDHNYAILRAALAAFQPGPWCAGDW